MSSNLHQAGVKLFAAMHRNADLIMQVYLSGSLDESQYKPSVIEGLKEMGILWRPEVGAELRLKKVVRELLESSLHDERNRQIDANIGSGIALLTTLAEHYKEALSNSQFARAQQHLLELNEHVYALTESLGNSVRVLFGRINEEFGYVASIDAKIRENQLAQSQVSELLAQLEMFRFDQLGEVAGSDRDLRNLLINTLQDSFAKVTQELSVVQARLLQLLGRFREFQGRTRLLKGFVLHLEQQPDYALRDYTQLTQIPALFNQAEPIIKPAAPDVLKVEHERELQQIVAAIKTWQRQEPPKQEERKGQTVSIAPQSTAELEQTKMKAAVEEYFCQVIDTGIATTALEYYQHQSLDYDPEVWLYQVIGGYQGLPEEEQYCFEIGYDIDDHPVFTGNKVIRDVHLGLR